MHARVAKGGHAVPEEVMRRFEAEYEPPQEKEEAPTAAAPDLYPTWTPR